MRPPQQDLPAPPFNVQLLPGQDRERLDSLPTANAFALSPFYYSTTEQRLPELEATPPDAVDPLLLKRLQRLRKSPGFELLAGSVLLLKAVQLDMDYPVPWPDHVRKSLSDWLLKLAGKTLDPDAVRLKLSTATLWVDEQDQEHDSLDCSLSELAVACADPRQRAALAQASPVHDSPLPGLPALSASELLEQLLTNDWLSDYQQQLERFWQRHAGTWRDLARLSLLDELARQFKRKTLHREGYYLALDALGYREQPTDHAAFERVDQAHASQVWLLYLNDSAVPGLFQVRSKNTAHCFIHRPGCRLPTIEYISDNPAHMAQRMLAAMNDSAAHRQWLYHQEPTTQAITQLQARQIDTDVFHALQQASEHSAQQLWHAGSEVFMFQPIKRSLTLASAVDLWQKRPSILSTLPAPLKVASTLIKSWLHDQHGLDLAPEQVFVAWRPGHKRTPLGNVRQAGNRIRLPASKPINLAKALVSRFQAEQPQGLIDEGGQWRIWHDPAGKGQWSADKVLPISAEQLARQIEQTDFLGLMTRRIEDFWENQGAAIEQALRATMVNQAVIALKQGHLQRSGFDLLTQALGDPDRRWSVLGFEVQSSFIEGLEHQPCASLLMLTAADQPLRVLYQAGQAKAFMQFADASALERYLHSAVADEPWRNAVLQYVPGRHRARLEYLFKFWAGGPVMRPPASIVRSWSDILYHPDQHKLQDQSLYEQTLPAGQPFSFVRKTLKANALEHAQRTIVTPGQAALRYWSEQLRHLQLLLAPMSILLTPGAIASLATELGLLALAIGTANLPGHRYAEKQLALLSLLSLGLWRLAPTTPRLLGSLQRVANHGQRLLRTRPVTGLALFHSAVHFNRMMNPRNTQLARFFHTNALLKRWTIAGHPLYSHLPVHAWKLGRKFLLWTSDRGQARTLVVSTHGYYLPWSKTVKIPNGTEIRTYAPHGYELVDPGLHRVINQRINAFAISTTAGNRSALTPGQLPPLHVTDKMIAGTSLPGQLKNYTLSKFQSPRGESYTDISQVVRNSNITPLNGQLPTTPMDVLSVRNRFASLPASLDELFGDLAGQGIHYDRIFLLHCRCAAFDSLLRRAPAYQVPVGVPQPPITP